MNAKLTIVRSGGRLGSIQTLCVKFTGPDGRMVSLAFDTRADDTEFGGGWVSSEHSIYADCPVQADGVTENAPVADLPLLLADLV
jgi:hypothetical protein